jgi:hypothetical protein
MLVGSETGSDFFIDNCIPETVLLFFKVVEFKVDYRYYIPVPNTFL